MKTKKQPSVAKLKAELKLKDARIAHLERVAEIWRKRYTEIVGTVRTALKEQP